jgi:hypothetical protein
LPYCRYCGKELTEEVKFCPNCGAPVVSAAPPQAMEREEFQRKVRPTGVSILAILEGIVSFFTLFAGVTLIGLAALLVAGGWGTIAEETLRTAINRMPWASGFTGIRLITLTTAFLVVIGIMLLFLAIIGFMMAWGLWAGKGWAWTTTIILTALGLLLDLFHLPGSIISILIYLAIIHYLSLPHVRAYYRK